MNRRGPDLRLYGPFRAGMLVRGLPGPSRRQLVLVGVRIDQLWPVEAEGDRWDRNRRPGAIQGVLVLPEVPDEVEEPQEAADGEEDADDDRSCCHLRYS